MTNRDSFVFYKSIFDAIKKIKSIKIQNQCYEAISLYGFCGIEPPENCDERVFIIFTQAKPIIDRASNRYKACVENGKKGGAPKGNTNAKKQPDKQPNEQPKNNLNDNDNDNVNVNDNVNERDKVLEKEFLLSLGKKYSNLTINVEDIDSAKYSLEKISEALQQSDYLQGTSIKFILDNYEKVIMGQYKTFKQPTDKPTFQQRNYDDPTNYG